MTRIFISLILFIPCFIRMSYTDIKNRKIEVIFILMLLPAALCYNTSFKQRIISALIPLCLCPLLGVGDILLYSALGFIFGVKGLIEIFCFSTILSGLFSLIGILSKRLTKEDTIAFVPFICLAAQLLVLQKLIALYT